MGDTQSITRGHTDEIGEISGSPGWDSHLVVPLVVESVRQNTVSVSINRPTSNKYDIYHGEHRSYPISLQVSGLCWGLIR